MQCEGYCAVGLIAGDMINPTFVTLVQWVIGHGYFLFFIAAFLEGPLITAAAGVAAALGYYDLTLIILLSVLADLCADVVYYTVGYWGRRTLITRYGSYVGLTKERMEYLEHLLHRHVGKALIIIKLSPVIPVPGLIMVGLARVPLEKFIRTILLITLPRSVLFALIGLYAGRTYERLSGIITSTQNLLAVITLIIFIAYIGYKKITTRIVEEIT